MYWNRNSKSGANLFIKEKRYGGRDETIKVKGVPAGIGKATSR
jgi:hypothetical protein